MLSLPNYKTGAMLLGGLFFYDVFWVFGTDVMVTVAKVGFSILLRSLYYRQKPRFLMMLITALWKLWLR